jgi:AraC-like DNA-binding protein
VCIQLPVTSRLLGETDGPVVGSPRELRDDTAGSLGSRIRGLFSPHARPSALEIDDSTADVLARLAHRFPGRRRNQVSVRLLRMARERLLEESSGHSLAGVAEMCGLSPSGLTHAFRRQFGCTPSSLIRRDRLDRAAVLLRDRRLTLSRIAARCGFADQSHFTREFRKLTGWPPGEYRRLCS